MQIKSDVLLYILLYTLLFSYSCNTKKIPTISYECGTVKVDKKETLILNVECDSSMLIKTMFKRLDSNRTINIIEDYEVNITSMTENDFNRKLNYSYYNSLGKYFSIIRLPNYLQIQRKKLFLVIII